MNKNIIIFIVIFVLIVGVTMIYLYRSSLSATESKKPDTESKKPGMDLKTASRNNPIETVPCINKDCFYLIN